MTEAASDAVRTTFRGGNPSEAVVLAVADAKNVDPLELEPLNSVIDPDALNTLFQSSAERTSSTEKLQFSMADCQVVVRGEGEVVVTPPAATDGNAAPVALRED